MLIPVMTVAENVVLDAEPRKAGIFLDYDEAVKKFRDLARLQLRDRSRREGGEHHRRPAAAGRDPEGPLPRRRHPHPRRADRGAHAPGGRRAVRDPQTLQREGMSIIFITHKFREVLEIADRITVLRRGKKIETVPREGSDAGRARAVDGGPRGPASRGEDPRHSPRNRCSSSKAFPSSTTATSRRSEGFRSRFGPGRSSVWPGSTATARAS